MAPMNVAETLLARDGVWAFEEIVGVIACPDHASRRIAAREAGL